MFKVKYIYTKLYIFYLLFLHTMIELEEMIFLLFNLCYDMNKIGLNYDEEFEVLLQWDEELKNSYNEIIEDENTDYSKYYDIYRYTEGDEVNNKEN